MKKRRSDSKSMPLILTIEDEKNVRESFRKFLEDFDYEVIEAEDGRAGLEAFKTRNPDVVLVDLRMPEVDGLTVLEHIREMSGDKPVIVVSGAGQTSDVVEALRLGAWNYLMKPIEDLLVLKHAIDDALERARLIEENRAYHEHLESVVIERTKELEKAYIDLRMSEEKYRTIFENLQDVYFEFRLDGTIIEISPSVKLYGFDRQEILNSPAEYLFATGNERDKLIKKILEKSKITDYEIELVNRNGAAIPFSVNARIEIDLVTGEQKICGLLRDISQRKEAHKAILESEQRFRSLVETMPYGILEVESNGRITFANEALSGIYGYSTSELVGRMVYDLMPSHADRARHREEIEYLLSARPKPLPWFRKEIRKDGTLIDVQIDWDYMKSGNGTITGFILVISDITDRMRAEEELRRNYEQLRIISELMQTAQKNMDLDDILSLALNLLISIEWLSVLKKGSIHVVEDEDDVLVMKAAHNLVDTQLRECSRLPFGRCLCGISAATQTVQYSCSLDERHVIMYEGIPQHGHYCIPVVFSGKTLGVINLYLKEGHQRDEREIDFLRAFSNALASIIQRKRTEREREVLILELQEALEIVSKSQKEWLDTFDSIDDMITIIDEGQLIRRANLAVSKMSGLNIVDIIGRRIDEIFSFADFEVLQNHSEDAKEPTKVEVQDPTTKKTYLFSSFPYHSEKNRLVWTVIIARDITGEREKEMRLIMSERLASLGQMAAGIAHEINNPLASIAGCAEGLLMRVQKGRFDPELFSNYLKIIEEEIMRCKSITTGMLSFVRKSAYEKRDISLNDVIEKTLEIISFQGRLGDVNVVRNYDEHLPVIRGNEGELRQVVLAVLINALDAMDDRGTLSITTGGGDETVFISISDSGSGISQENRMRIFDPFFTTKSDKGGTGLGLAIASKIISNHGGSIDVASDEGQGTTVNIMITSRDNRV